MVSRRCCDASVSCYHPQYAVVLGIRPDGKKDLKFLGSDVAATLRYPGKELVTLPCGQCIGCRIDRSRQWANRCMLELQYHDSAYFATLTYDDFHVPKSYYGGQTHRPHYHVILFGLHLFDLQIYKRASLGDEHYTYYNSPSFQECWPAGYAVLGEVNWQTCAYTARYVTKKLTGKESAFYT